MNRREILIKREKIRFAAIRTGMRVEWSWDHDCWIVLQSVYMTEEQLLDEIMTRRMNGSEKTPSPE